MSYQEALEDNVLTKKNNSGFDMYYPLVQVLRCARSQLGV